MNSYLPYRLFLIPLAICLFFTGQVLAQQIEPDSNQKRLAELNVALDTLAHQLDEISLKKKELEKERSSLLATIAQEQNEASFEKGIAYPVVQVSGERTVTLLINGREQMVSLSGVYIKTGYTEETIKFLNRELLQGIVYLRCTDQFCAEAQLYTKKDDESLNCKLVNSGLALLLLSSPFKCPANSETSVSTDGAGEEQLPEASINSDNSSRRTPGTEVQVRGYYRKDGTYVKPHTRSRPRRKN